MTAIAWAEEHDAERVSLNVASLAAVFRSDADVRGSARLRRRALATLRRHGFQLGNLLGFNRTLLPDWERRYVVYERQVDLPRVGIAGLAAKGCLPLAGART